MPRLRERLARLEHDVAVSARVRETSHRRGPYLWERIETGLRKIGFERTENESVAEWLARAAGITMTEMKQQLRGDWRADLSPGTIGYYIGGLLVVAEDGFDVGTLETTAKA